MTSSKASAADPTPAVPREMQHRVLSPQQHFEEWQRDLDQQIADDPAWGNGDVDRAPGAAAADAGGPVRMDDQRILELMRSVDRPVSSGEVAIRSRGALTRNHVSRRFGELHAEGWIRPSSERIRFGKGREEVRYELTRRGREA